MWENRELENRKLFLISWWLHLACPMFCIWNWISSWNMIFVPVVWSCLCHHYWTFPQLCVQFFRTDWTLCFPFQFSSSNSGFSLTLHLFSLRFYQLWLKWMAENLSELLLLESIVFWIFSELMIMLRLDHVIAWLSLSPLDVGPDLFFWA